MATNIGTAFFNVTFNTAAARREVTAMVSHVNRSFGLIGGAAAVGTTALIAGLVRSTVEIGTAALGAANDYEQAFADVRKTLDEGQLSAGETEVVFDRLNRQLRDMALRTPLDLEDDITQVAALGAQLGIATNDIEEFTEVITEVGVTTNIAVEDAATGFARLANIMGLTSDEFRGLGDSLIALGNNLPAQEDEILRFSLRTAAAGEIVGFTADEVLALSGAMASVGIPAERGGTAIQRTMIKIEEAVATGSESLALFAEVAGLSAEQFTDLWERDASEAFTRFVEGLGQAGSRAFTILGNLELAEQRTLQALLSIANAGPLLRDSFQIGVDAAGALARESGIFFDTTQARIKLLQNTVNDVAIDIGNQLQGPFRDILELVTEWIDTNPELIESIGTGLANALTRLGDLLEENLPLLEDILGMLPNLVTEVIAAVDPILDLARGFAAATSAYLEFRDAVRDEENFGETAANAATMNIFESLGAGAEAVFDEIHDRFNTMAIEASEAAHDFDQRSTLGKALFGLEQQFARIGVEAEGALRSEGIELMRELEGGAEPVQALADSFLELQNRLAPLGEELTADMWNIMVEGIDLTAEEMRELILLAQQAGVIIPREIRAINDMVYTSPRVPQGRGDVPDVTPIPPFDTIGVGEQELIDKQKEALKEYNDALADVRDGFIESGLSAEDYLNNIQLLNPEMQAFVRQTGEMRIKTELLEAGFDNLRASMLKPAAQGIFGIGDIVEGIDQLTREIEDAEGKIKEIPVTTQFVTDQIIENMNTIAEFEANLVILFASGFETLATEMAKQGPEVADIVAGFVDDTNLATAADNALESGGVLGDETQQGLDEALNKAGDNPALLEFAASLGSTGVLSSVYNEGREIGDKYGQGVDDGARPWIEGLLGMLGIEDFPKGPVVPPFGQGPGSDVQNNDPDSGTSGLPGVGSTGGANVINLSFSASTPLSEAARAGQLINALVVT